MDSPIILIPGITGTKLTNTNLLDFVTLYSVVKRYIAPIEQLSLQPDSRFDAAGDVVIERGDVEDLAYGEIYHKLKQKFDAPIFIFGYDWRRSNAHTAHTLKHFTDSLSHRFDMDSPKFRFVTHSMGGLIFWAYLKLLDGHYDSIDRAVITACPFMGSLKALPALVVGEGGLPEPLFNSRDDFRKIGRTFPSLYELLPLFEDAVVFKDNGKKWDIYDQNDWQSNLWRHEIIWQRLKELKRFRKDKLIDLTKLSAEVRKRILVAIGTGEKTLRTVKVKDKNKAGTITNVFKFDDAKMRDGDGTLPVVSGIHFKDSLLTLKVEKRPLTLMWHSFFLNDARVQNIICRFLAGRTDEADWYTDPSDSVTKA